MFLLASTEDFLIMCVFYAFFLDLTTSSDAFNQEEENEIDGGSGEEAKDICMIFGLLLLEY